MFSRVTAVLDGPGSRFQVFFTRMKEAMQRFLMLGWKRTLALVALTAAHACAFAAERAGTVSFVIGDARAMGADSKLRPLTLGDGIDAGETLVTGSNGHVYLRMVDDAFIVVRSQSRLHIEDYHIDTAVPGNNRIKFNLQQGVARSITGRGGEAARQNYRFNTPLAAIGIRGTDFVVQASNDITRVAVQSGAVVFAPLADGCLASALGPCNTAATRVLTAAMHSVYLELRSRNDVPLLVPAEKALESPNLISPPRPEEPHAGNVLPKSTTKVDAVSQVEANTIITHVDTNVPAAPTTGPVTAPIVNVPIVDAPVVTAPVVTAPIVTAPVVTAPIVTAPPVIVPPPPAAQFWWGRWSNMLAPGETSIVTQALAPGTEITYGNDAYGLVRTSGTVVMPNTGVVKFQLADSEASLLTNQKILTPAQITSPSLTVDFGARTYDTSLTVTAGTSAPVLVQSSGNINFQGLFDSKVSTPYTVVHGLISNDASQAGYIFQRDLSSSLSVLGVTRWTH